MNIETEPRIVTQFLILCDGVPIFPRSSHSIDLSPGATFRIGSTHYRITEVKHVQRFQPSSNIIRFIWEVTCEYFTPSDIAETEKPSLTPKPVVSGFTLAPRDGVERSIAVSTSYNAFLRSGKPAEGIGLHIAKHGRPHNTVLTEHEALQLATLLTSAVEERKAAR